MSNKEKWEGILRSKGFFWVSADHKCAYEWAQAGGVSNVSPAGIWYDAVEDKEALQIPEEQRPENRPDWDENYGDRMQLLVFIGQSMDEDAIRAELDACHYVHDVENLDMDSWNGLENPFPVLDTEIEEQE